MGEVSLKKKTPRRDLGALKAVCLQTGTALELAQIYGLPSKKSILTVTVARSRCGLFCGDVLMMQRNHKCVGWVALNTMACRAGISARFHRAALVQKRSTAARSGLFGKEPGSTPGLANGCLQDRGCALSIGASGWKAHTIAKQPNRADHQIPGSGAPIPPRTLASCVEMGNAKRSAWSSCVRRLGRSSLTRAAIGRMARPTVGCPGSIPATSPALSFSAQVTTEAPKGLDNCEGIC